MATGRRKDMEQVGEFSRRRLILAGTVLVIGIVCLFCLLELLLWAAGVESIAQRRRALFEAKAASKSTLTRSDTLGWAPRPSPPDVMASAAPDLPFSNRISSLGFRGEEISQEKPEGMLRILCLGDSCTYGAMVSEMDAYPGVLERLLATQLKPRQVEVINGGVVGYSSLQALLSLEEKGFALSPDIVTICACYNDAGTIPGAMVVDDRDYLPNKTDAELYGFWPQLATKWKIRLGASRVFSLLDRAITSLFESLHEPSNNRESGTEPKRRRVGIPEYEANLTKLADECRERGIEVVMMSLSLPDEYAAAMRRTAEATGVTFIDTEPVLAEQCALMAEIGRKEDVEARADSEEQMGQTNQRLLQAQKWMFEQDSRRKLSHEILLTHTDSALFLDPCHPTPLGYRIIAELMAKTMFDRDLLKK
ncbi:MAG: hypothetical protein JW941_11405 [Candidatus Coatesbacteria bacterium]|nr:hypothetical protein [Candidatus Coatesbacteria bacterium]